MGQVKSEIRELRYQSQREPVGDREGPLTLEGLEAAWNRRDGEMSEGRKPTQTRTRWGEKPSV